MFSKTNCDSHDIYYYYYYLLLLLLLLFSNAKDSLHRVTKFYETDSGYIFTGQIQL